MLRIKVRPSFAVVLFAAMIFISYFQQIEFNVKRLLLLLLLDHLLVPSLYEFSYVYLIVRALWHIHATAFETVAFWELFCKRTMYMSVGCRVHIIIS